MNYSRPKGDAGRRAGTMKELTHACVSTMMKDAVGPPAVAGRPQDYGDENS